MISNIKELEALIRFWKDGLAENRLFMSPPSIYQVEQTIKNLEELKQLRKEGDLSDDTGEQ